MKYLYIDTSSSYLYSAIVEENKIISEIKEEFGQSLSEVALPKIVSMFEEKNLSAKDIDKIRGVNGPGSFTGIRIGITIAKVYAWSLNIAITTISALVPMINARRGYVFAAIYDENYKELLKPQHIKLEDLKLHLEKISNYEIISNNEFEDLKDLNKYDPDILKIVNFFKDKESISPHAVNPEYLKLTEAEEKNHDNWNNRNKY